MLWFVACHQLHRRESINVTGPCYIFCRHSFRESSWGIAFRELACEARLLEKGWKWSSEKYKEVIEIRKNRHPIENLTISSRARGIPYHTILPRKDNFMFVLIIDSGWLNITLMDLWWGFRRGVGSYGYWILFRGYKLHRGHSERLSYFNDSVGSGTHVIWRGRRRPVIIINNFSLY